MLINAGCNPIGDCAHAWGGVAHGDCHASRYEHRDIVVRITDGEHSATVDTFQSASAVTSKAPQLPCSSAQPGVWNCTRA